jgi:AhpD family alkylhydroperoxidase
MQLPEIRAGDNNERDSIALAVSEVNGINYCLTVHSFTAEFGK